MRAVRWLILSELVVLVAALASRGTMAIACAIAYACLVVAATFAWIIHHDRKANRP